MRTLFRRLIPKPINLFVFLFLVVTLFFSIPGKADTAPITYAGVITNATTAPGGTIVPVTVTNFINIGWFTLTLKFDTTKIRYIGFKPDSAFSGMTVTKTTVGTQARLAIFWTGGTGITLPDLTHLLDLTFTYKSATASLSWGYTSGLVCQYKKYVGSTLVVCSDSPKGSYYINGGVSYRGAPVVSAPVISNAVPGAYVLPIKVNNLTTISAISLNLEYDSTVLTFTGYTANAVFGSYFPVSSVVGSSGKRLIVIGWYGASVTLANGSTLVSLNFTYTNARAGYSTLNWYENGPSCEFVDGSTGSVLLDTPSANYYKNGLIYSSAQFSPQSWLPIISNATPAPGGIVIPVNVSGFSNIKSFNLSFDYDTTCLTYSGFVPNPVFGASLIVTNNPPGTNGRRTFVLTWIGSSAQSLADGSALATLSFTYKTGSTSLAWITGDAVSCRFNDAVGNSYYDLPKSTYYQDGLVGSHLAPITAAWYSSPVAGQSFALPVKVFNFSNISTFTLTFDYDPGVLTYQSSNLVSAIGGTYSATPVGLGRLVLTWNGTAASVTDSSTLLNLIFLYRNSGSTPIVWIDDGNSCKYTQSGSSTALYDQPKATYYINGYVGPNPLIADFTVNNALPEVNATVTFSDLTTGSPTSWNWSISPSTFLFTEGTNAASQNPKVKFTTNGVYTISLRVTRSNASGIKVKGSYMHAGTPGLWTGIASTDWTITSNWHNYMVPTGATDVVIPATGSYWPVFNGDFTIGVQCKTMTLSGPASNVTINGNLVIN